MKKLLIIATLCLYIVACKKDTEKVLTPITKTQTTTNTLANKSIDKNDTLIIDKPCAVDY